MSYMVYIKYPQCKKIIYTTVGIWGLTVPSIITYVNKLNSIPTFIVENYRHMYFKDIETANAVYFKFHTNFNGCLVGLICGELYMKYLRYQNYKKIFGHYLKYTPLIGWPLIFWIWYLGTKIIFKETTLLTSIFPIFHRHFSVIIVAVIVIVRGLCTEGGGFLSHPIFRPLARIAYQIYLWHLIIIFTAFSSYKQMPENTSLYCIYMTPAFYIPSVILATVMAIIVEYPIAELLTVFDLKGKKEDQKIK